MSKEQLEKEKDFIMLRASNYHYDLGVEHEKESALELIDKKIKWQKELIKQASGQENTINTCECIIHQLEVLKSKIGKE